MTRITIALATLAAALALPAAAAAKGASSASLHGPNLNHILALEGSGEPGNGTPLGRIADLSGFYPSVFGQEPVATQKTKPNGELGPRYMIRYLMPGPDEGHSVIRQDIYPYAKPFPVTYVAPNQPFFGSEQTVGGWYVAPPALKTALVEAGLPANSPAGGGFSIDTGLLAGTAAAAAVVLLLLAALRLRRRPRPSTA
jgi:hypothetical protein